MIALFSAGCREKALNDPYPNDPDNANTLYSAFGERPKHLDPARSYSSNEWAISNQIYETPLQYHYLLRPYTLEPLLLSKMPEVVFLDEAGQTVAEDSPALKYTRYTLTLKPDTHYQPHPAFAQDSDGTYRYHQLDAEAAAKYRRLSDFEQTASRELTAEDMVYQIKRLASPQTQSPIFGFMANYIFGLAELREKLESQAALTEEAEGGQHLELDLRSQHLAGAQVRDKYTYEITIKGLYPQFLYWLSLQFFAPMPWEAIQFYNQPGLLDHNISLDWYPVGTGPYQLVENNPNLRMILSRNPNYHGEAYPSIGDAGDKEAGLLDRAGQSLPFIERIHFSLEKESIPYWNKFLQGYYDRSGISNDSFDQAIQVATQGQLALTDTLEKRGIRLLSETNPSISYWGFNMSDPVVGGSGEPQRHLRTAISMVFDVEEYIQIFLNGRGMVAHSPLPPGIFGFDASQRNPELYEEQAAGWQRKSLETAQALLAKAGYPAGIDPKTGEPLVLYLDAISGGGPDLQSQFAWIRKQFQKLGISLVIRDTQYNRFQEKMRTGNAQIFSWGWNADYPDPENFLFLLYGPNGKVKTGGENATNYDNPRYDALFDEMKHLPNTPARQEIIQQMVSLLQQDSPWIFGFYPKSYTLEHQWMGKTKINPMSRNTLKYESLTPSVRQVKRHEWNKPWLKPVWMGLGLLILLCLPAYSLYRYKLFTIPLRARLQDKT